MTETSSPQQKLKKRFSWWIAGLGMAVVVFLIVLLIRSAGWNLLLYGVAIPSALAGFFIGIGTGLLIGFFRWRKREK
jgi:hypothetical protein